MRITLPASLARFQWTLHRCYWTAYGHVYVLAREELPRSVRLTAQVARQQFRRPQHAAKSRLTRATLSFRDAATLDWLRTLKTPAAENRVTPEVLVAQYMARMAVIARGPYGMRGALIAACDLTDRLAAAVYTAQARQTRLWYGAR